MKLGDIVSDYLIEFGNLLRSIRKSRGLTIQNLADKIYKSKSTLSKYERGEIAIDIVTLDEIARVLKTSTSDLLPRNKEITEKDKKLTNINEPSFFKTNNTIYTYYYDGRNKSIVCSKILIERTYIDNSIKIYMYMNINDLNSPQICENTYYGSMVHYDTITRVDLINRDISIEKASIVILSPFIESDVRWGLWTGISNRPVMPASIKMLFTKEPLKMDNELKRKLIITQEDYKHLKYYNMFTVY